MIKKDRITPAHWATPQRTMPCYCSRSGFETRLHRIPICNCSCLANCCTLDLRLCNVWMMGRSTMSRRHRHCGQPCLCSWCRGGLNMEGCDEGCLTFIVRPFVLLPPLVPFPRDPGLCRFSCPVLSCLPYLRLLRQIFHPHPPSHSRPESIA